MVLNMPRANDRDNNFNLIRLLAAGAVLVSHAYPICFGPGAPEPLDRILGISLGTLAVLTFFAISGYFISQSFHRRHSILDFAVARTLRIYPALLVVLILTVVLLGPFFTTSGLFAYVSNHETLLYVPKNLLLLRPQYELPGVFESNAYPAAINGSLWTLAYEVACYALVAIIGLLGLTRKFRGFAVFLFVYIACYIAAFPILQSNLPHLTALRNFHLLVQPFVVGMVLFQFRKQIPLSLPILVLLGAASWLSYGSPWFQDLFVLAWSYGTLYVGFVKYKPLLLYNKLGDYSYGIYIYAFPVEQVTSALYKHCTPIVMIVIALPLTFLFATLSWHTIEERALAQRSIVSRWLRVQFGNLANSFY